MNATEQTEILTRYRWIELVVLNIICLFRRQPSKKTRKQFFFSKIPTVIYAVVHLLSCQTMEETKLQGGISFFDHEWLRASLGLSPQACR